MRNQQRIAMLAAVLVAAGGLSACADTREQRLQMGELSAQRLLDLADVNKDGSVSKEEFLRFMGQEFDRLDANKDQRLTREELQRLLESTNTVGG
jgi:Ca2+-binding EF-hand superfamily protein